MKISEVLKTLEEIKKEKGDIDVMFEYEGPEASCYMDTKSIRLVCEHNPKRTVAVLSNYKG